MNFLFGLRAVVFSFIIMNTVQAQTCYDTIKKSAPTTRYMLFGEGTEVYDTVTKLTWKRCSEGLSGLDCSQGSATMHSWLSALSLSDVTWRLPNIKELASLVETACYEPAINMTVFPNTPKNSFWSSSPYSGNSHLAWFVYIVNGTVQAYEKYEGHYVRLVRREQ